MADDKLDQARALIFAWRGKDDMTTTVRSDQVEELLRFLRQRLRRRLGAGIKFASFCAECNRRDDDVALHPATAVCLADNKSGGSEYLQDLLSFLESHMIINDALESSSDEEKWKDQLHEEKEKVAKLQGEKDELEKKLEEAESEKMRVEDELEMVQFNYDEMKEVMEEEEEEKCRKEARDAEVKSMIALAFTALRVKDSGTMKKFKNKLEQVEKSFYLSPKPVGGAAVDDDVGDDIDVDDVLGDPPHASMDSADWPIPPMPAAIAARRRRFGPIGDVPSGESRASSRGSSIRPRSPSSRRSRRSSSSASRGSVKPVKALPLMNKEDKEKKGMVEGGSKRDVGDGDGKKGEDEKRKEEEEEERKRKEEERKKDEERKKRDEEEEKKRKEEERKRKKKKKKGGELPDDYFDDVSESEAGSESEAESDSRYPGYDDPPPE